MTTATLRLLLWKDMRHHRIVLIGSTILLLMPLLYIGIAFIADEEGEELSSLPGMIQIAGMFAMYLAIFSSSMVGGASFASERADGSADVLQLLVPRRGLRLASRVIFSGVALGLGIGVAIGTFIGASIIGGSGPVEMPATEVKEQITLALSLNLAAFSVAWMCATVLRSASISACIGIAAAMLVPVVHSIWLPLASPDAPLLGPIIVTEAIMAVVAFTVGCIIAMRRVEP